MIQNTQNTFSNLKNINQKGGGSKIIIFLLLIIIIAGGIAVYILFIKPKPEEEGGNPSTDTPSGASGTPSPPAKDYVFKVECTSNTPPNSTAKQFIEGEYKDTGEVVRGLPKYMNTKKDTYVSSNTSTGFDFCKKNRPVCKGSSGRSGYIGSKDKKPATGNIFFWGSNKGWNCAVKYPSTSKKSNKKAPKRNVKPFWSNCYKDEQCNGNRDRCIRRDCRSMGLNYKGRWQDCGGWKFRGYCQ